MKWMYNKEDIKRIVNDFSENYELKLDGDSMNLNDVLNCEIINTDKGDRIAQFLDFKIIDNIPYVHVCNIQSKLQPKFEAYMSNFAYIGFSFKIVYYGV